MSQLPKEIVDKITKEANDFAGKQGKDYPIDIVYKHMIQSQIADAYKAAALHYSQIIEEIKQQNVIQGLKFQLIIEEKDKEKDKWELAYGKEKILFDRSVELLKSAEQQIKGLKAENEGNGRVISQMFADKTELSRENEKLQSQIKRLVLALTEIKNFDDESEAEWGDPGQRAASALTNYYNSTKQPSDK